MTPFPLVRFGVARATADACMSKTNEHENETRVTAAPVSVHLSDPSVQERRDSQMAQREITATIVRFLPDGDLRVKTCM